MNNNFIKPGNLIDRYLKSIGIFKEVQEEKVLAIYDKVVGNIFANFSKPLDFKKGILVVKFSNSALRQEAFYNKNIIISKYNKYLGGDVVKDIKFI